MNSIDFNPSGTDLDANKLAEILGMKVAKAENENVYNLYVGDYKECGIQYRGSGTLALATNKYSGYQYVHIPVTPNTLLYRKSDNGAVFGIPSSGKDTVTFGYTKGVNLESNEESWVYFTSDVSSSAGVGTAYIWNSSDGIITARASANMSSDIISLAPVVLPSKQMLIKNLYDATYFVNSKELKEFSMNGKEYVGLTTGNASFRIVFEL